MGELNENWEKIRQARKDFGVKPGEPLLGLFDDDQERVLIIPKVQIKVPSAFHKHEFLIELGCLFIGLCLGLVLRSWLGW